MKEITIINPNDNENDKNFSKGYLTFPFDGNQFKDFITGLLGKPQTIDKRIYGDFDIHLADLQSFFDLVNQRITQQNNGQLIQFTSKIYYKDKSSVQLGCYEELVTYNETKPIISEAVKLTWDYLIKFSDKQQPEKQSIELLIISTPHPTESDNIDIPSFLIPSRGQFRIHIEHTARSWGSDIEGLLTNQIKSILKKENKLKKFVIKHSSKISLVFSFLFLLTCILGAFKITNNFILSELEKVKNFNLNSTITLNEKIDYLSSYIAGGIASQHYFKVGIFILISVIMSIIMGIWISETSSRNTQPSFIVLTRKSKEYRDRILDKMKRKWTWFFVSLLVSITTGILSNFIFKLIVG